jgi:V8-like Glu-specific endopeptidase
MRRQQNWTRGVDDTTHFPFSAICHLLMTDDGGTQYSGTGFYIARDRILTCGHNIHYDGLGTRSVVVTPGKNGSGASAGTPFTVAGSDCIIHPQWRSGSGYNRDFDLAVLRVTTPPPDNRWFPFLDDRGMSVAPVTVCGYAGETVDSEKQHLDIDMVRGLSPSGERADYDAATQQGSSGSPVFYVHGIEDEATQTSRYEVGIVGVHTSGNDAQGHSSADRNSCCLLTAAKTAWIRSLGGTYGRGGRVSIPVVNRSHRSAAPRLTLPGAHERYGRGDLVARAKEDGGYFTDADQLGAQLADTRLYDTRKVSTLADAYALIATFRSGSGGAWPTLDRNAVADAMKTVIDTPESIQQGGLNLCGPASFLNMWAGRDPVAFVRFASALYNQGQASIGTMAVTPGSRMRSADYGALSTRLGGNLPDPASWMVMGSLRDDSNAILPYDGQHAEDLAGLTTPEELTSWMNATGIWTVRNEADWTHILPSRGIPHATGLYEYDGQDISLLINANMLAQSRQPIGHLDRNWILSQFPNHFVVLRNSPVVDVSDQTVHFRIWTWAGLFDVVVTQQVFLDNYYGAVIGRLR